MITFSQIITDLLESYIHPSQASQMLHDTKKEMLTQVRRANPHLVLYDYDDLHDLDIQHVKYALFLDHEKHLTDLDDVTDHLYRRKLQRHQGET